MEAERPYRTSRRHRRAQSRRRRQDVIYVEGGGEGGGAYADGGAGRRQDHRRTVLALGADGGDGNDVLTGDNIGEDVLAHGGNGNDRLVFASYDLETLRRRRERPDRRRDQLDRRAVPLRRDGERHDPLHARGARPTRAPRSTSTAGPARTSSTPAAADDVLHFLPANGPAGAGRDVVHGYQHGQDHIALDGGTHFAFVGETKDPGRRRGRLLPRRAGTRSSTAPTARPTSRSSSRASTGTWTPAIFIASSYKAGAARHGGRSRPVRRGYCTERS